VVDYKGLHVGSLDRAAQTADQSRAEVHVVKNSIFRIAAKEAGLAELNGALAGQLSSNYCKKDISTAAKVVKTFVLSSIGSRSILAI